MGTVYLIATGHREHGLCNSHELLKVIEVISPEVIFEEIPSDKFSAVYDGRTKDTLETATIKRYLQENPIDHFPVDLKVNEVTNTHFRREVAMLFQRIAQNSSEYRSLWDEYGQSVAILGFPFLNSDQCSLELGRMQLLEREILKELRDSNLVQVYNDWLNFLSNREDEMIRNIYSYSKLRRYDRALFLVGAEHRKPLIDKIQIFNQGNEHGLNWIFNYFSRSLE